MPIHETLRGVVPVLATPFDAGGRVDLAGHERVVDHVCGSGVTAVMVFGLASEGATLTDEERTELLHATTRVAGDHHVSVVASVAGAAPRPVLEAIDRAVTDGADAVNLLPVPAPGLDSGAATRELVDAVAAASPLPVVLQHLTGRPGALTSAEVASLHAEHPNLVRVKVESQRPGPVVSELAAATPAVPTLVGLAGLHLPDAVARGAVGVQPGCSAVELYLRLWDDLATGEEDPDSYRELVPDLLHWMQSVDLIVAIEKAVLVRRGLIAHDRCRAAAPLGPEDRRALDRFWTRFGARLPAVTGGAA